MPLNEYDEILSQPTGQGVAGAADDYAGMLNEDKAAQKGALQQSMYVAAQTEPERKAKVLKLSRQTNIPPPVVDRNLETISKKAELDSIEYDELIKESPGTANFLTNTEHASVARDDVGNLRKVENTVRQHSMRTTLQNSLLSGLASTYASVAKVPALFYDAFAIPQNIIAERFDIPSLRVQSPQWLRENPVSEFYTGQAEAYRTPEMSESIIGNIRKGDYTTAGAALAAQFAANAPQQAAIILGTITGYGIPAVIAAGTVTAAEANAQAQAEGNVDPATATVGALAKGTIESAFERLGTFGIFKHWEGLIAKEFGKGVSREVVKSAMKSITYSVAAEANEEAMTSIAQDYTDYITGVNPQALEGIGERAINAGILGGSSGGAMTAPSAITAGLQRGSRARQSTLGRDFYNAMGDAVAATKLKSRDPETNRQYIESLTKDTPVANVYIPASAIDTYFQSKKEDPGKFLSDINATESYAEAQETGADVKVPLAKWMEKVAGTPEYKAFADDVKFDPGAQTVNEAKADEQAAAQALKEAEAAVAQPQEEVDAEAATQASGKAVVEDVEKQLREIKADPKQAALYRAFEVVGKRAGVDPFTLYQRYNLRISRGEISDFNQDAEAAQGAVSGPSISLKQGPRQLIDRVFQAAKRAVGVESKQAEGEQVLRQEDDEAQRGQIRFNRETRQFNIELLKDADPSTFIHETGHFYTEVLGDVVADLGKIAAETRTAQQSQLIQDYETLLSWAGAKDRASITTEQHEQIARGFEAYLMEGKAPSAELRSVFNRFKIWLTSVYRNIKNLNVQLSSDVRNVFDRLLATDEEIQEVEREQNITPLFENPSVYGMTGAKAEAYEKVRAEAHEAALTELSGKMMADYQRQQKDWYEAETDKLYTAHRDELLTQPLYGAILRLQSNEPLPDGTNLKISRESVQAQYGSDYVRKMPKGTLAAKGEGLPYAAVAEALGFESGSQMIEQMTAAPSVEATARIMAEREMLQKYPDIYTQPVLTKQGAIDAVHNNKRAQLLRMELEHLATKAPAVLKEAIRRVARRVPTEKAVREQAAGIIAIKPTQEIRPYVYQRAEAKAAKEAGEFLAKGDFDAAFEAKRRELLNFELYRAAREARTEIDKAMERFKPISRADEKLAKSRDMDLVNAARAILSEFGLSRTEKTAAEYLKPIRSYDPDTYANMLALVESATERVDNWRNVSYNDFIAMRDSVLAIWDLSKSTQELNIDGKKLGFEEAKTLLADQINAVAEPSVRPGYERAADNWDKVKMQLLAARAALTRVESWADAMDVGNPEGPFRRLIWNPVSEGVTRYRTNKAKIMDDYRKIVQEWGKGQSKENIPAPNLNYTFRDKTELMMAVLHSGNESNLSKLLRGRGWGELQADGTVDRTRWDTFLREKQRDGTLTKADFDFAQKVWDLMESLKPDTQRAHKEMYGYYFNEITANALATAFGEYRGGYIPAKVDIYTTEDAAIRQEREAFEKNNNSFSFPTTGRGATKQRVQQYAAPLSLEMGLLAGHIDWALRFTFIEPAVKQTARIVQDQSFRQNLAKVDSEVGKEMLTPWLQRAATQQVVIPAQNGIGKLMDAVARYLRKSVGMQIMAGAITNTIQQFTGVIIAASKVKPVHLRNAVAQYAINSKQMTADILEKSEWMRNNQSNSIYESYAAIDQILVDPSTFEKVRDFSLRHTYFLQSAAQNMVNSVFLAVAYEQAVQAGANEKDAVRQADSAVRQTQGTVNPEDISRFETGTATARLFTQFTSYFNMLANLNQAEVQKIARETGLRKGAGKLFYVYLTAFALPAALSELMVRAMAGAGLDEDDDDNYLDDMLSVFFGSQFRTMTAMTPYLGTTINAAANQFNEKRYDDRIALSPVVSTIETMVGVPAEVYKAINGEMANKKRVVKDILNFVGVASSLPIGPLGKPAGYLIDVAEGKAQPTGPVDFTRGLVTGRPGAQ